MRYLMSPDGSTIVEKRPLHKAILEFRSAGTPGRTLAGHFHSHILSDVPEDTDVFYVLNLTRKPPLRRHFSDETGKRPMILPVILEV